MTDATTPSVPAVACTLGTKPLERRVLEWSDLSALALTSKQLPTGASATFELDHADAVEDLARRELNCCGSWLDIATQRLGDTIQLTATTRNPDGLEIIRAMLGLES